MAKKKQKLRPVGQVLLGMEPLLLELVDHQLQWGDILNLVRGYLEVHAPEARELYEDGTEPQMYYGIWPPAIEKEKP